MRYPIRKGWFRRIEWRMAFLAFLIASVIWYWVRYHSSSSPLECKEPLFDHDNAMMEYRDCLERRRTPSVKQKSNIGVLP